MAFDQREGLDVTGHVMACIQPSSLIGWVELHSPFCLVGGLHSNRSLLTTPVEEGGSMGLRVCIQPLSLIGGLDVNHSLFASTVEEGGSKYMQ